MASAYEKVIQDYQDKGYIRKVSPEQLENGKQWFLPHFPIVKKDRTTTKTRLVFDASAQFQGISLNNNIHVGPKLQRDLPTVLARFRRKPIGIMCDIAEMYLQIELDSADKPYHRFLWRGLDAGHPPEVYEFNRVVFGVNASPFLAQLVTQAHDRSNQTEYQLAAEAILKSTYMDDCMDSVDHEEAGLCLYGQLSNLWSKAGMHARKWTSNFINIME